LPDISTSFELKQKLKIPDWAIDLVQCPSCNSNVKFNSKIKCINKDCEMVFPIVDGIPILIDTERSIFEVEHLVRKKDTYYKYTKNRFIRFIDALTPSISTNIKAEANYTKLSELLLKKSETPKVLVLGGGILGKGIEKILSNSSIYILETDIVITPRTMLSVDAHSIPFKNNSFDCVIAQAMLEHVIDPYLCVKEIHRVLKCDGFVYAETAFMQQVHGGRYDFTRFTRLGYRRLFAKFQEIENGAVCGTGMALAWAYEHFLMSLTKSTTLKNLLRRFARFTGFWLKYFDYFTIDNPTTLLAASGYYFIGRKSDQKICDKTLIHIYDH